MLEALRRAGAPPDLLAWVQEAGPEDAWDGCDRPHWLTWMAACRRVPVGALLSQAVAVVLELGDGLEGHPAVETAVASLLRPHDTDDLDAVALACERLGERGPRSYRSSVPPPVERFATALALLLRAEEGLRIALASAQNQVDLDAMFRATGVGVPPPLMARTIRDLVLDPLRMDDEPTHQNLAYVVDAMGEGLLAASRVPSEEPEAIEEMEVLLTDRLWDRLPP